jgi:RNA polymerase sigma factor (sigma-70 family)
MDSITLRTAALALRAETSPSVTRSRVCSEGDDRRFTSVVLPYLADAYALARWLTNNHADSEDVVHDACLRALHGIGSFANGDARAWVLTIVRRTAYDWLNRNRPAAIVLAKDLEGLECTQLPGPDAAVARDTRSRQQNRQAVRQQDDRTGTG